MVVLDGTGVAAPNDLPPEICVHDYILPRVSAAAWGALLKRNDADPHLFRYGGRLVRLHHDGSTPTLQEVTKGVLKYELGRSANWYMESGHNKVPALPPFHVIDDMLAYPDPPLPHLDRVTQVPVFSPAGVLISTPGFNEEAGIYYAPQVGPSIPEVPISPSPSDVQLACSILEDLLADFPFTSKAERAHAIAAALLPFVRSMIHGATPLHLFEKPTPGTGAGLLASVLCYPALGGSPTIMTLGNSEDETRRTLTAKLGESPVVVLLDNVHTLDSAALSAAITTPDVWTDRLIRTSAIVSLPVRCLWLATGNNPSLSSEITRRVVRIRMDARMARPEERTDFRHPDLMGWVQREQHQLVWALLTLAQAWVAAGRPDGDITLGSFESWARVVGGILNVAGIEGFLTNRDELGVSDMEGGEWSQFVSRWWGKHSDKPVGVADLFPLVNGDDPLELQLGDGTEKSQRTRLGMLLRDRRDRIFGEYQLVQAWQKHGAQLWRLQRVNAGRKLLICGA